MPLRILEYELEIIKSAINYNKLGQKSYKMPIVYPIVLYTGKGNWNAKTYIKEIQEKLENESDLEKLEFSKYNIVNINELNTEKLLKEKDCLSKLMLAEKDDIQANIIKYFEEIVKEINSNEKYYRKESIQVLIIFIEKTLSRKIGKRKARELIEKLKGGDEKMLKCWESIDKENERIFNDGIKTGIKTGEKEATIKIIKEMVKKKIPINIIAEISNYTEEKIMKIVKN